MPTKTELDDSTQSSEAMADGAPPAPQRSAIFSIIKGVAFVSVIVIVEIVAAAMLAPSAQETAKLGERLAAAAAGETTEGHEHAEEGSDHHESLKEVALGTYNITRFNPATNTTLAIDFELYGTVLAADETEFHHLFDNSKARIREQVTMTLHGAESSDLTDAGLGLIKRRILEKTNRAMGQPLLKEVLFSKFSFVER